MVRFTKRRSGRKNSDTSRLLNHNYFSQTKDLRLSLRNTGFLFGERIFRVTCKYSKYLGVYVRNCRNPHRLVKECIHDRRQG